MFIQSFYLASWTLNRRTKKRFQWYVSIWAHIISRYPFPLLFRISYSLAILPPFSLLEIHIGFRIHRFRGNCSRSFCPSAPSFLYPQEVMFYSLVYLLKLKGEGLPTRIWSSLPVYHPFPFSLPNFSSFFFFGSRLPSSAAYHFLGFLPANFGCGRDSSDPGVDTAFTLWQ